MLSLKVSMTESDSKVKDNNRNKNSWAVILQVPWWLHLQSCFHFAVSLGKCFKLVLHIPADPFLSPFLLLISTSTDNHCRCASYAVQNRSEKKRCWRRRRTSPRLWCGCIQIQLSPNNWLGTLFWTGSNKQGRKLLKMPPEQQFRTVPCLAHQNINYSHLIEHLVGLIVNMLMLPEQSRKERSCRGAKYQYYSKLQRGSTLSFTHKNKLELYAD